MARKSKSTEEIIGFLREAEVRLGQGKTVGKICRSKGITEQSYYRYRSVARVRLSDSRVPRNAANRKCAQTKRR